MHPLDELFYLFEDEVKSTPKRKSDNLAKRMAAAASKNVPPEHQAMTSREKDDYQGAGEGAPPDAIIRGLGKPFNNGANHPKLQDPNPTVSSPTNVTSSPSFDPDGVATVGEPEDKIHPVVQQNRELKAAISQGLSPEDAFIKQFGDKPTAQDAEEISKIQGAYDDDKLRNIPEPEKDSQSIFGKDVNSTESEVSPDVSELTKNAPDFVKSSPAFTTILNNESNDQFLERSKNNLNGLKFVDVAKSIKGVENLGIAPKYLDLISRALVSTRNKDTEKISYFAKGAGAGAINSQVGEVLSMVMSQLDKDNRKSFYDTVNSQIEALKAKGVADEDMIVQKSWLDAAEKNATAIDNYIAREFPGAKIIGGAWDNKEELQTLGIGPDGEPKGAATDIVIRDSNGVNHQLSLKKSDLVNLTNGSANVYRRYMLNGIVDNPDDPRHELAMKFTKGMDVFNRIYDQLGMPQIDPDYFGVPKPPAVKDIAEALGLPTKDQKVKAIVNELRVHSDNIRQAINDETLIPPEINSNKFISDMTERLSRQFSENRDAINNIKFNVDHRSTFEDALDSNDIPEHIRKLFYSKDGKIKSIPPKISKGIMKSELDTMMFNMAVDLFEESKLVSKGMSRLHDEITKVMKSNNVSQAEAFDIIEEGARGSAGNTRKLNKMKYFSLLSLGGELGKQVKQESKQNEINFANAAVTAINTDPNLKRGMIGDLRRSFPIKDIAEGKETMIVGDTYLSRQVLKHMLGTDKWDDISERIEVKEAPGGRIYLGYILDSDPEHNGKPDVIPLADIKVRQDGVGYGNSIKHEFKFSAEFGKRLRQANAELGTNVTTEDIINLFHSNSSLLVESIRHLLQAEEEETGTEPLDEEEDCDYNGDVEFLRKYGRA